MEFIFNGPKSAPITLALAHGAGQGMDSPFMEDFAAAAAGHGIRVARFDFPYMTKAKELRKRRPPDREPVLRQCWADVIGELGAENLIIGGKSMGGRMASLVADEHNVAGLVALGYPFHPPGKPDKLRTAHLETLKTAALICQGTRDPFGKKEEAETYKLSRRIEFFWVEDGEHSFKPRKTSGRTLTQNIEDAATAVASFVKTMVG